MSAKFEQVVEGSKPVMVDLGEASGIIFEKVTVLERGENEDVTVTVSYLPIATGEEDDKEGEKLKRKNEVIATIPKDKTEVSADFHAIDEMEPSIFTVDGAKVKIEGSKIVDENFDDEEDDDDEEAYQGEDDDDDE